MGARFQKVIYKKLKILPNNVIEMVNNKKPRNYKLENLLYTYFILENQHVEKSEEISHRDRYKQ